jgi:hypothetical protein
VAFLALPDTHTCENTSCCDVYSAIICSLSVSSFPLFQESEEYLQVSGILKNISFVCVLMYYVICDEELNIDVGTVTGGNFEADAVAAMWAKKIVKINVLQSAIRKSRFCKVPSPTPP